MATGDVLERTRTTKLVLFLDAVTAATADGVWIDAEHFHEFILTTTGGSTSTVQVRGSNAQTKPANNTHGVPLTMAHTTGTTAAANAVNIASDGSSSLVTILPRWVKVQVTANAGTLVCTGLFRSRVV